MVSNSATVIRKIGKPYSDFSSERQITWSQEPISRQIFIQGRLINGIYVVVGANAEMFVPNDDIEYEFAAWETARDEALLNFAKENLSRHSRDKLCYNGCDHICRHFRRRLWLLSESAN